MSDAKSRHGLTDYFLEDVLERSEALHVAILVGGQGDPLYPLVEN